MRSFCLRVSGGGCSFGAGRRSLWPPDDLSRDRSKPRGASLSASLPSSGEISRNCDRKCAQTMPCEVTNQPAEWVLSESRGRHGYFLRSAVQDLKVAAADLLESTIFRTISVSMKLKMARSCSLPMLSPRAGTTPTRVSEMPRGSTNRLRCAPRTSAALRAGPPRAQAHLARLSSGPPC